MTQPTAVMSSRTSLISSGQYNKPAGICLFGLCFKFRSAQSKRNYYKGLILLLTFIAYAAFHMGRRPLSVVKNVLNRNCSAMVNETNAPEITMPMLNLNSNHNVTNNSCDWAPFDDDNTANQLLAYLDSTFLASYAIFMFVSGMLAERTNLRYFISAGSILSGATLIAFGLAYHLDIHSMEYFLGVQVLGGAFQATGWPVVVTCVSNWFEPAKRGLIYGLWNSHTNLGNILGATIAGFFVEKDWGLSFIVPGAVMIIVGIILFLFLVPSPMDIGLSCISDLDSSESKTESDSTTTSYASLERSREEPITSYSSHDSNKAVSFLRALRIPGVIEYSWCLFFSKLVSYTFLYWLPRYISSSTTNNSENSAYLSTPFDIGGVAGAILAGYLTDRLNMSATICNVMLILAIPMMFVYQEFGSLSSFNNISLQLVVGALVNGPYCLITTAVSADLGARIKDGRAMATVAAIIDGMGSIGAVLGPLFAGLVAQTGNWRAVFAMLMLADVFASLCLIRITVREIRETFFNPKTNTADSEEGSAH